MKRDMDLVRKILMAVEAAEEPLERMSSNQSGVAIDGYTEEQVRYHLELLDESHLISGEYIRADDLKPWTAFMGLQLTWEGHEFLDAARDEGNWEKAKDVAAKAGGWTLSVLKDILVKIITGAITGR